MKNLKTILISSLVTLIISAALFSMVIQPKLDETINYHLINKRAASIYEKNLANDDITAGRSNVITNTVSRIKPAVVGINVTEIRQVRDIYSQDPFWRYFFGDRVYNQQIRGLGSGVIISSDGYIITNDHVAGNAVEANVTLTDGRIFKAKILGSDQASDLCLLKIDAKNLPFVPLGNSDDIIIGEWTIALGNPFGLFSVNDQPTVTVGVISATGMNLPPTNNRYYINMIQTDAAINSGNSGGPLVNAIGELVGLNTLIYTAQGSSGNVGVGFAIPVNKIKRVIDELKQDGKVNRNFWTGLNILTIDENLAKTYGLKSNRGVIITQVSQNSPAQKAGIQVEDIILGIDNYKITDENTLISVINEYRTDDTIELKILRGDSNIVKKMKLERK
ncbi:MAG: trypsin-like peptidase domain-containing protein [Melioribacteraceae bacterium]|jgi:serine protease Do|nr:trypsin-like peptidase domain-containing protein [Melioribacteraceae bacterium]